MPVRRNAEGETEFGPTWEDLVERQIRAAQERGEFDGLEGAGRPLALDDNPFAGDWGLAHKLLKDAGFAPPWIELQQEIEREREALTRLPAGLRARRVPRARAWQEYRQAVDELNARIDRYNLMVPFGWLQQGKLTERASRRRFDEQYGSELEG